MGRVAIIGPGGAGIYLGPLPRWTTVIMDRGLRAFLDSMPSAEVDAVMLATLEREMTTAIPVIEAKIREQARWAAKYRWRCPCHIR